jgi:hypothetical protein
MRLGGGFHLAYSACWEAWYARSIGEESASLIVWSQSDDHHGCDWELVVLGSSRGELQPGAGGIDPLIRRQASEVLAAMREARTLPEMRHALDKMGAADETMRERRW